ncbi:heme/copper-type cytochrome/quinol oxidase subunit 1 [Arthrobacter pigmenti]|uniref:Heme/copper-type cytochrome/quinol oxidase subunit 1 n=1 Tax=Arthrobacter pigmenti TaxID=271432 RepID=A0A846RL84_9MICC|nr:hypothetical protein [Arthrobacter pigmenti]NJC23973.1 heme/copper-type cytochrome/quinol oxidase subunit 1 [Arthrobacter pigmenti]
MNWVRANRLLTAGVTIAVVGLVLMGIAALAVPSTRTFGWFAYAPLAEASFTQGSPVPGLAAGEIFGTSIAAVGLVLITGALAYYRARRA